MDNFNTTEILQTGTTNATHADSNQAGDIVMTVCRVVEVSILLSTFWILLRMIVYGVETKKWRNDPDPNSMDRGAMYMWCVIAVAMTLPRIIFTCVLLFTSIGEGDQCEIMQDVSTVLYFFAVYPAYFFLWLRQKAINKHPAAENFTGKYVGLLSWIVLIMLTIFSVVLTLLFIVPTSYGLSSNGCVLGSVHDKLNKNGERLYYILALFLAVSRISLLGFFIYPMLRCTLDRLKRKSRAISSGTEKSQRTSDFVTKAQNFFRISHRIFRGDSSEQSNSLERAIRRSVCSATIATVSDIITMAVTPLVLPTGYPLVIADTIYDARFLVQSLCILATFGGNRKILGIYRVNCNSIDKEKTKGRRVSILEEIQ